MPSLGYMLHASGVLLPHAICFYASSCYMPHTLYISFATCHMLYTSLLLYAMHIMCFSLYATHFMCSLLHITCLMHPLHHTLCPLCCTSFYYMLYVFMRPFTTTCGVLLYIFLVSQFHVSLHYIYLHLQADQCFHALMMLAESSSHCSYCNRQDTGQSQHNHYNQSASPNCGNNNGHSS